MPPRFPTSITMLFSFLSPQYQFGCPYMHESSVDWIFKVPACLVLIINLVFLFSIMWVSCECNKHKINLKVIFGEVELITCRLLLSQLTGAYNETEVSQHGWNEAVSESFESSFSTYSALRTDIFNCTVRAEWRNRKEDFRYCESAAAEYTGKWVK